LTTGEMARLTNSTLRTVRFYEEEGLLKPAERIDGGHRLFSATELEKLKLVGELRLLGLPLEEIKQLLEAKRRASSGGAAARALEQRLDEYSTKVDARIEALTRLRDELGGTRKMLQRCESCTDNHLFPESCAECRTMKDAGALPPAATILWDLRR
jgi:DNA-binding transcriptional MerR regulator